MILYRVVKVMICWIQAQAMISSTVARAMIVSRRAMEMTCYKEVKALM